MLYANAYEQDETINTYQAYTEAIAKLDDIMQPHEAVLSDATETEPMVSTINETLIEQEPESITYSGPVKKVRTQTGTTKPVKRFRDAINPPTIETNGRSNDST